MLEFLYYFMYTERVNSCENFLEKHIILCTVRLSLMTLETVKLGSLEHWEEPIHCFVMSCSHSFAGAAGLSVLPTQRE